MPLFPGSSPRPRTSLPLALLPLLVACAAFLAAQDDRTPPAEDTVGTPRAAAPAPDLPDLAEDLRPAAEARFFGRIIERIDVRGLQRLSRSTIDPMVPFQPGERFDRERMRRLTTALWEARQIANARVFGEPGQAEDSVVVVVEVVEQPVVERLALEGATKVPTDVLLAGLPFQQGDILPNDAALAAERALRDAYGKKGYHEVGIAVREEPLVAGAVAVVIRVTEGSRLLVDDIVFEGNASYSGWWLGFEMSTGESVLFIPAYFNREVFRADLASIADYYRSQGYLRVRVTEGDSRVSEDGLTITPVVKIEEGPRFTVAEVRFADFSLFTAEELARPFAGLIGRPYDREEFNEALGALRRLYGDEGWLRVAPDVDWTIAEDGASIVISIALDEGERITVGNITYEPKQFDLPETEIGAITAFWMQLAPPVQKEVVLRRIRFRQGEPLRQREIEATERALKDLRVFRKVTLQEVATDLPAVRDVRVVTEPSDTAWLYAGVAVGEDSDFAARVTLTERNLGGRADAVSLSLSGGDDFSVSLSYLDRDLGASDWSARYTLFRSVVRRRAYDSTSLGVSAQFSREIADRLTESWRVRFADVAIDDIDDDVLAELDDYQVAALRYRRALDMTDDNEWPTRGYYLAGDAEVGYADTTFTRLGLDASHYQPLFADTVWAATFLADVMPLPSDRDDLGIDERLYLGGRGTIRGFRARGIGPKDEGEEDLALGGLTRVVLRNEVRFPLGADAIKGVLFADAGWLGEDAFEYEDPRASAGFGLRLFTERVNIAIDFGFPILRESGDDRQVVQFAVDSGI